MAVRVFLQLASVVSPGVSVFYLLQPDVLSTATHLVRNARRSHERQKAAPKGTGLMLAIGE